MIIDKLDYKNIEIPDELDAVVNAAIAEGKSQRKKNKIVYILKKSSTIAAVFMVCFITLLNTSPVLAQAAYEIPVIGNLCRVFTFRDIILRMI